MKTTPLSRNSISIKRNDLICLEFDAIGNCFLRRLSRTELLKEAGESLQEDFSKLQIVYSDLSFQKNISDFPLNSLNERDKRGLLKFFRGSLQSRDIRQVDPAFSARPVLWVRHNAILLSLEQIRAVILYNRLFLFDPDNPKVKRAGKIISERLEKTINGDIDVNSMPYEFRALEGIFVNVCLSLEKDFSSLEPTILENLDDLPTKLTSRQLEELRSFKQRLSQFSARSQEVQRVIQEILEEDENMINMYLTEKSTFPKHRRNLVEHEEIEIISESYLQIIDHLTNRAELLDNAIDDTEDLVTIRLDTIRNKILFVELTLNILGLAFAAGSLVSGIFGMNLGIPIFKEENGSGMYFAVCVFVILCSIMSLYWWLFNWCKEKGLYST